MARALGFEEEIFALSADQMIDRLLALPSPLRRGIDREALAAGRAVELSIDREGYRTASGKIEILNPAQAHPLPRYLPSHEEGGTLPFRLMTAPNPFALNATFYEQEELRRKQGGMRLQMNPADAAAVTKAVQALGNIMTTQVPDAPLLYGADWNVYSTAHFTGWVTAANPYMDPSPSDPALPVILMHLKVAK